MYALMIHPAAGKTNSVIIFYKFTYLLLFYDAFCDVP